MSSKDNSRIQQLHFGIYKQDHDAVGSQTNAAIFGRKETRDKTPTKWLKIAPIIKIKIQKPTHIINDMFYLWLQWF